MGRKKKETIEIEKEEQSPIVHGDAKRSAVAIFLFALAILFVLGFLSDAKIVDAGPLGKFLDSVAGWMFGVGKYISPIVLIMAGIILLFRKETLFYVSKIAGIFMAFASVLGLIHILAYEPDKMLAIAKAGEGGGFLGYILGIVFFKLVGTIGSSVILVALMLIGIIVAFNFSLVSLFQKFIKRKTEESEEENSDPEDEDEEETQGDPIIAVEKEQSVEEEEFVPDAEEEETESRMDHVLKKAAAWMPKGKEKEKEKKQHQTAMNWELPPVDLLEASIEKAQGGDVKKNAKIIQDTLRNFGIEVEPGEIKTGPTVTQYSFRPAVGVKLSRITTLSSDLALRLAARQVRIEAPIPGKSMVGIEVPNKTTATIRMPELLQALEFENRKSNLLLALGKDVSGNYIFGDLKKMPHLLIAGSTGSGKSVCVNTILISMLYQNSPEDLRLILVDPKRVELTPYNGIPHLLADVIVENGKVLSALKWAIGEMERRYKLLQGVGSKDISSFNKKAESGELFKKINTETGEITEEAVEKIPYIVIVIDELADLMASHGKEVEGAIIRLAQMARAIGIHLILSTQKPIVTVITSLIKSNIPTRIAFRVPSLMDSRTILDASGAEKLLGNGDMLFSAAEAVDLRRVQGVFVSEEEVKRVVDFIKKQKFEKIEDDLEDDIVTANPEPKGNKNGEVTTTYTGDKIDFADVDSNDQEDALYEEAKKIVIQAGKASSSLLQRRLRVGYSRAARLIDMLEDNGIIGEADGAKPREILVAQGQPAYDEPMMDQAARDKWQM
ncbi:MAG: translocase FtsK protein [Candidatus Moranbacteria bacterium GW2011_GWC2_37_8]|nr:MAG: translocase FtsK protein [Candidatus Moranbacteria bacterium GW2011_GWC2_37_8]KKQ61357.1 MAG: translocase FtsK protein [Parcubacteria group bacterium GW2011_GWC1_38_22]